MASYSEAARGPALGKPVRATVLLEKTTPPSRSGCSIGRGRARLALLLGAFGLSLAAPAWATAPGPDPSEQAAYASAVNMAEPGPRADAMEDFAAKFPKSARKIDALEQAMASRQANNEPDKVDADAKRILALEPDNARALAVDVVLIRGRAIGPTTPQTITYADDAAAQAERGLKALARWKPPAGAADTDVTDMRNQMAASFNGALGFRGLIHGDYAAARPFYQAALKADPTDMNNTYQYAVCLMQSDPVDPAGFWWAARAYNLAASQGATNAKTAIEANAKARFMRYHGSDQGWDVLITQTAATLATASEPPTGFAVKPAPSAADLAVAAARGGSLAALSIVDWEFILAQRDASPANHEAADKVWKEIQDFQSHAQFKFPVKVLAVSAGGLDGAVIAPNQAAGVPDLHLKFAETPAAPAKVGSIVSVVGVLTDYSVSPFAFTMEKATIAP
jgi:hypothetical protein